MLRYKFLVLFFALSVLISCTKETLSFEDHFYVVNDGASMPVYVRGHIESDVIILFLHGGPGGNATQATFIPSFQTLEAEYAVAYWDQRASGLSQGNPDESTFTIEQFVEDLDYVMEALKLRYPSKSIFLFGHSWGGALGSAYLSDELRQDKVKGFICMNSGHNLVKGLPLSVQWVASYADEQLAQGNDVAVWNTIKSWCAANPDMTVPDNYFQYVEYLNKTDAYRHDNQEVSIDPVTLGDILNSRMSLAVLLNGPYLAKNFNILEMDLSQQMNKIKLPSAVIWGVHDGVNVLEMAYDAHDAIGTAVPDKRMILLENSAHEGYLEEPDHFVLAVSNFINDYR